MSVQEISAVPEVKLSLENVLLFVNRYRSGTPLPEVGKCYGVGKIATYAYTRALKEVHFFTEDDLSTHDDATRYHLEGAPVDHLSAESEAVVRKFYELRKAGGSYCEFCEAFDIDFDCSHALLSAMTTFRFILSDEMEMTKFVTALHAKARRDNKRSRLMRMAEVWKTSGKPLKDCMWNDEFRPATIRRAAWQGNLDGIRYKYSDRQFYPEYAFDTIIGDSDMDLLDQLTYQDYCRCAECLDEMRDHLPEGSRIREIFFRKYVNIEPLVQMYEDMGISRQGFFQQHALLVDHMRVYCPLYNGFYPDGRDRSTTDSILRLHLPIPALLFFESNGIHRLSDIHSVQQLKSFKNARYTYVDAVVDGMERLGIPLPQWELTDLSRVQAHRS